MRSWLVHALLGLVLQNCRPVHLIGSVYLTLNVGTAGRLLPPLFGHLMLSEMRLVALVMQWIAIPACRGTVNLHAHAVLMVPLL